MRGLNCWGLTQLSSQTYATSTKDGEHLNNINMLIFMDNKWKKMHRSGCQHLIRKTNEWLFIKAFKKGCYDPCVIDAHVIVTGQRSQSVYIRSPNQGEGRLKWEFCRVCVGRAGVNHVPVVSPKKVFCQRVFHCTSNKCSRVYCPFFKEFT